ncbi:P-type conjugative transfer protein VirB9 [Allorhizobium sp. BGMRC 0089]|uniref:P-type conjugative transfer protein VirB9 n=1 Tax=Allorhizobium sonneratiae TaxID=2934936 RepID=UPI002033FF9B|nr:P-type conjugative transfer protein VirB9 [Allorhizobium sonneratiae]MCM2294710.1 P-type conjugative transfer protein VirB9 [Allorhizobium sonneratiae]
MKKHIAILAALSIAAPLPALAMEAPKAGNLDSKIRSVVYQENNVVRIDATYGISTVLMFDPAEKFETVALGDTQSWQIMPNNAKNMLFLKPVAKNAETNLTVVTDQHVYFLELHDHAPSDHDKIYGVRFIYPENQKRLAVLKEAQYRAAHPNIAGIDKSNVNYNYSYSGTKSLKPVEMFDDGKKTFFRFVGKIPAIFAVGQDYKESLVNFRTEGRYIVVDGVAKQYTLRDGELYVCIFNLSRPDMNGPRKDVFGPKFEPNAVKRWGSGN